MSELNENSKLEIFDRMSTKELEEILRQNSELPQGEEYDMGAIIYISEVIARREKDNPTGRFTDVNTAWESFEKDYYPIPFDGKMLLDDEDTTHETSSTNTTETAFIKQKRPARPFIRFVSTAAVVAVVLLMSTITAYAMGFDLWEYVAQWSRETFSFTSIVEPSTNHGPPLHGKEGAFDSLQATLDSYDITGKLVPQYMPEGFELVDMFITDNETNLVLISQFSDGSESIVVQYSVTQGGQFQKDEDDPEIYESGGVQHYIMTNMGRYHAVWISGDLECSIFGLQNKDDLIKMIDSIYRG